MQFTTQSGLYTSKGFDMTIRTYLKKRILLFISMIIIGGMLHFYAMFLAIPESTIKTSLLIIAATLGLPGFIGFVFFIKCPQCKRRIGDFMNHFSLVSVKKERGIQHCPYCGVNFDEIITDNAID